MYSFDTDLAMKLYEQGLNDVEIGKQCGVANETIGNWRHKNQLEPIVCTPKFDESLAKELYLQGLNDKQIAIECDTTYYNIRYWRHKNNYLKYKSNINVCCLDKNKAKLLYDKKFSDRKISRLCGVAPLTVKRWRQIYNLPDIKRKQKSPLYDVWRNMIARCENPATINYKNYGARGITVCSEWHNVKFFIE